MTSMSFVERRQWGSARRSGPASTCRAGELTTDRPEMTDWDLSLSARWRPIRVYTPLPVAYRPACCFSQWRTIKWLTGPKHLPRKRDRKEHRCGDNVEAWKIQMSQEEYSLPVYQQETKKIIIKLNKHKLAPTSACGKEERTKASEKHHPPRVP